MAIRPVAAPPSTRPDVVMRALLRKVFSLPVVLGVFLLIGVSVCARLNLSDPEFAKPYTRDAHTAFAPDIWWQIVAAEEILSTRTWPTTDSYSFTVAGNDWMAYQWLADVLIALAARVGDLSALMALLIGLSATLVLLLYYYAYVRSGSALAAFLACALLLPVASVAFTLRPQLFGYIFLLVTLICLERFRQGRAKALWILPAVFLLWANTHGTFPFGLLALGLYWAGGLVSFRSGRLVAERWTANQRRHLAAISLLCLLALTLTPYGTRLATYPLDMAFLQPVNASAIHEWHPLPLEVLWGKLVLGLLLFFFLAQLLFPLTYRVEELSLLLFAIYAAFVHRRMAILFVLIFAPLLAALLARWIPSYQFATDRLALNFAFLILMGGLLVGLFPSRPEIKQRVAGHYPRGAVEYLRHHPVKGPMFNSVGWGGYLIRELGPEHKVFIDSRLDMYEYAGVLSDYLRIANLDPQALYLLHKYGIEACLLQREAPLATVLATLPNWAQVYVDELSTLFLQRTPESESSARPGQYGILLPAEPVHPALDDRTFQEMRKTS